MKIQIINTLSLNLAWFLIIKIINIYYQEFTKERILHD